MPRPQYSTRALLARLLATRFRFAQGVQFMQKLRSRLVLMAALCTAPAFAIAAPPAAPQSFFGYGVSFGDNGRIFAVAAPREDSGARDIDGDQTDTSSPDSGAVWLY
jgi:hypothetical protein